MKVTFVAKENLSIEDSFGNLREGDNVKLKVTIGIVESEETGWFELRDKETGGDIWFAEGGLWFNGKELTEYDGVSELPKCITQKLIELGFEIKNYR
jgi:hypothetical protein